MIWAILILLGIPLWLIAIALFLLMRTRSKVGSIPGSVRCKVRTAAPVPGLSAEFPRHVSTAHWVHDVLVVHSGTFLIRTLPLGTSGPLGEPQPVEAAGRLRRVVEPVSIEVTLDSGAVLELVCARSDAASLLARPAPV